MRTHRRVESALSGEGLVRGLGRDALAESGKMGTFAGGSDAERMGIRTRAAGSTAGRWETVPNVLALARI